MKCQGKIKNKNRYDNRLMLGLLFFQKMCIENEICKKQVYDCNINKIKWLLTENSKQKVLLEDSFSRDDSGASPFFHEVNTIKFRNTSAKA